MKGWHELNRLSGTLDQSIKGGDDDQKLKWTQATTREARHSLRELTGMPD